MFWKFDLHTASQLEKLLEKDGVTLQELLDEDDVLQECKAQNQRLLLFLTQDSNLLELISLVTHEPPSDREEKLRYKYANTACELLTCDVSVIHDKVGGDDTLLNTLYSFLEQEPPLNPLLASFFSKTFGSLINHKTEQTVSFLRKKEGFIKLVLKHMDTSAMMDFLLRLISCVEPAQLRYEVQTWLDEEKLIQRLTELIQPHSDSERQSNASQALCDIIRVSRDQTTLMQESVEPTPLLTTLELQKSVEAVLKNMFEGEKSEVCIIHGTQVLLTLLEMRKPGVELIDPAAQQLEQLYTVNNSILLGIQPYLKHYHHLLLNPPKKCSMLTTLGILEEPFGNARLQACRLIVALLNTHAPRIHHELCQLDIINLLLDLFFKFTWNNFLHVQVQQCVFAILHQTAPEEMAQDSPEHIQPENVPTDKGHTPVGVPKSDASSMLSRQDLIMHLFQNCRLVQRILDAWDENDKTQAEGGMRRGYMGHLTRIANDVVQSMEKGPAQDQIPQLINGIPEDYRERWQKFVDKTLVETNKKNAVDLVFSDYQIQQMTANFVDQFGFNDDEFGEHDDSINATFNRLAGFNSNLVDEGPSVGVFEACNKEKTRHFEDADEEEDIWEDKEINYATQIKSRSRFGVTSSSLKNEVEGGARTRLDSPDLECFSESKQILDSKSQDADKDISFPQSPGWVASFEDDFNFKADFATVAIDTGSGVWGDATAQLNDTEEKGWAAFTDFQPFCCSDSGVRCSSPVDSESQGKQNQDKKVG
ncbi:serine/threonine-protein phosphatase 6 regulatory subunit 2 isoform X2 [Trichomycterus rosablanca]|uniref:serine/threonine-protein phosphatase 6 regulatory subunit 2 isoform X2 n=1 Tax=Trichomycterus rosablanca TaxID=2290929 RepID=UPI002F35AF20